MYEYRPTEINAAPLISVDAYLIIKEVDRTSSLK